MLSLYDKVNTKTKNRDVSLDWYAEAIRNGDHQKTIMLARHELIKNNDPKAYNAHKSKLPGVTGCGVIKGDSRSDANTVLNGYIVLDIDRKPTNIGDERITDEQIQAVANDPHTKLVHRTPSEWGICVFVKIDPDRFTDAFHGLQIYYLEKFGMSIDASCKNPGRFRFLSYDPAIIQNTKCATFKKYVKKTKIKEPTVIVIENDFAAMVNNAQRSGVDLTDDDYSKMLRIGFGIATEFGEMGRDYFHALCSNSLKYNRNIADRQFTQCVNAGGSGVSISTVYYYAMEKGLECYSEQSKNIIKSTARDKRRGLIDDVEHYTELRIENEGWDDNETTRAIVQKVVATRSHIDKTLDNDNETEMAQLENFIRTVYPMEFDIFKQKCTFKDGSRLEKRKRNSIYVDASKGMPFTVAKSDVDAIIDSTDVEEFNPLERFIKKHREHPTANELNRLVDTLNIDGDIAKQTAIKKFVKKWFVSIFASTNGDYSPLCLVLQGEHGDGKSYWLEHLLPDELKSYCAFYTTTGSKEDTMMLHQNIIIVNDEFGGQTMKDAQKFKELVSKPVAKYIPKYSNDEVEFKRVAVFAGTTNEETFLNDGTGNRRIIPVRLSPRDDWSVNGYSKPTNQKAFAEIDKTALMVDAWNTYNDPNYDWRILDDEIEHLNENTSDFELKSEEHELVFQHCVVDSCGKLTSTQIKVELQRRSGLQRLGLKKIGFALAELGATKRKNKSWEWNVRFRGENEDGIDSTPPWTMPDEIPKF